MQLPGAPNSISETVLWVKTAHDKISMSCAVDDGTASNDTLASYLSQEELYKARLLNDPIEHRHFLFRRSFQRMFLQAILNFAGSPDQLELVHQRDKRPVCANAPNHKLSFSSSAGACLAGASDSCDVGVDIERLREIENAVALARRFFTEDEVLTIDALPGSQQSLAFLKSWTAKEAGLKATGKGIVSGLNNFVRTSDDRLLISQQEGLGRGFKAWTLEYVDLLPDYIVAVVHRPLE